MTNRIRITARPGPDVMRGKEYQPGNHEQQQAQADRSPGLGRPVEAQRLAGIIRHRRVVDVRLRIVLHARPACAPAAGSAPAAGRYFRTYSLRSARTSLASVPISFSSAAYCLARCGLPSIPFSLDAKHLQRFRLFRDRFIQFRLALGDLLAVCSSMLQSLRRRRDFVETGKTERVIPRTARRTVPVVHWAGRSVLAGNGVSGEQPPQAAELAHPGGRFIHQHRRPGLRAVRSDAQAVATRVIHEWHVESVHRRLAERLGPEPVPGLDQIPPASPARAGSLPPGIRPGGSRRSAIPAPACTTGWPFSIVRSAWSSQRRRRSSPWKSCEA